MTAVELLLDEADWQYTPGSTRAGRFPRTGRLRVWRDESGRLIGMLSVRGHAPDVPGTLDDGGCDIPDQIRARFPDHDIEIFAYEHSCWAWHAGYYRAGWADDGTQRWADVDSTVLSERLSEAFVYDDGDYEETMPGGA